MEKLTWFKFVISDWMMGKIMKCPEVTQARFIRLCCLYWNKECMLSHEDAEIEVDEEHLRILLAKKIVVKAGDFITIKFLDEQNDGVSSLSDKRSAAANARWERIRILKELAMQDDAFASIPNANAMQNDAEKSREEKKREEEIKKDDVDEKKETPSSSAFPFFTFDNFEAIEINTSTEFSLYAHRQTNRSIEELVVLKAEFVKTQKAISKLPWKDEADAKMHFINWAKKQPKTPTSLPKAKETTLQKHKRRLAEQNGTAE